MSVEFCDPPERTFLLTPCQERLTVPGKAWRIVIPSELGELVTAIGFMRKKDAELAMRALQRFGIVDLDSVKGSSFEERQRIMIEALQW